MRIKEFSTKLGISPDTVRRLEGSRLRTPSRDWAGHRRYTEEDLDHAMRVLFGKKPR